ncbi:MAG: uncharacterized protein A8A55_1020 [Amphiamblys sp. WSBS2006]|nr:MAG: uncharacterized protein A8A55_1020 [Amphiamblys sp. WSBS2006]
MDGFVSKMFLCAEKTVGKRKDLSRHYTRQILLLEDIDEEMLMRICPCCAILFVEGRTAVKERITQKIRRKKKVVYLSDLYEDTPRMEPECFLRCLECGCVVVLDLLGRREKEVEPHPETDSDGEGLLRPRNRLKLSNIKSFLK